MEAMMTRLSFHGLLCDRSGNFGLMTAVLLPVLIGGAGIAVDVTHVMQQKSHLQSIADAATLAAASRMSNDDISEASAMAMAREYLTSQYLADLAQSGASKAELDAAREALVAKTEIAATATATGGSSKAFEVTLSTGTLVPLSALTRVLGFETIPVNVTSTAESAREGNALSMVLVLDESGSMAEDTTTLDPVHPTKTVTVQEQYACGWRTCTRPGTATVANYVTKISALKSAAAVMFAELKKASAPDTTNASAQETAARTLMRIGAVSYTHETKTPQEPAWGTTAAAAYVTALPATPAGGTDASGAMAVAFSDLKSANPAEAKAHKAKGNDSFARFIVLMTDGEMTGYSNAWNRSIDDKVRAACQQAKDDKITIFTVAFMAPDRGKALLQACASGTDNYYASSDMSDLVTAFGDIGRKAARTAVRLTH
jgi:Flp pilus assembly protein TadG